MPIRTLSSKLQKKAELELNEVPGRIQEDVQHIRDWLAKQPHLKCRTGDQWILSFLRGCKFSLEKTKEKLDLYCSMRSLLPECFANRDPLLPEIQECLKAGTLVVLPATLDSSGAVIGISRAGVVDPEKVTLVTVLKVTLMIIDILTIENDNFSVAGDCIIMDMKGTTFKHIVQMTPSILKKGSICLEKAYPTRPQGIHFINPPSIFESAYNLLKTILPEKIAGRMHVYNENNLDALYKFIPLSLLPKEYGGEGDSIDDITAQWKLKVESYRDWFLEDALYCSDETKRPGKPRTSADMFGVEGSFRKLNVD